MRDRIATRDSILLTYYWDRRPLEIINNRGKQLGNFLLNEVRHWNGNLTGRKSR
ncbi:MAG: hypothetical protein AB7V46_12770 [Thermomicrobiales bacterium]